MITAAFSGFFVSLSLIFAIGAQNALVLRQGLRREHVGTVVAICALSDALLIAVGVAGFGAAAEAAPWIGTVMRLAGAAFLFVYGALRFRAAWQGGAALVPTSAPAAPRRQVAMACLLLTWANPHVYLDTLMLIGSVSTRHAPNETAFGVGAVLASLVFFVALGYGARGLAPLLRRATAWVVLEVAMGVLMWTLAAGLVWNA
ncbi:LysE/ArgO family amino acid transporter [Falsirhodobacter halotolerans]|uniref:LysE/ArgO family amino acid transporter n=1 Tax=Falsirhodobacter halotolerans TaxID=1146892 RepID=UPI001FD5DE5E|nr:LysE family transporter [Falsirhodobacter halotolerans]MCJ8140484.1 LysE family transporter [Falsirhodobacter halotolerans]